MNSVEAYPNVIVGEQSAPATGGAGGTTDENVVRGNPAKFTNLPPRALE
jgi:hypothetical protein